MLFKQTCMRNEGHSLAVGLHLATETYVYNHHFLMIL